MLQNFSVEMKLWKTVIFNSELHLTTRLETTSGLTLSGRTLMTVWRHWCYMAMWKLISGAKWGRIFKPLHEIYAFRTEKARLYQFSENKRVMSLEFIEGRKAYVNEIRMKYLGKSQLFCYTFSEVNAFNTNLSLRHKRLSEEILVTFRFAKLMSNLPLHQLGDRRCKTRPLRHLTSST
jgi:hypothetical protein